jgi:hypothetical protein
MAHAIQEQVRETLGICILDEMLRLAHIDIS